LHLDDVGLHQQLFEPLTLLSVAHPATGDTWRKVINDDERFQYLKSKSVDAFDTGIGNSNKVGVSNAK